MIKTIIFVILCFSVAAWSRDYSDTKVLKLDAASIESMDIEAGAGYLNINGTTNSDEIVVTAEIEISDINKDDLQQVLERDLVLTLEREGDRAVLKSWLRSGSWFSRMFHSAHINLTVDVPENIRLYIDDGSGSIKITRMNASIELDDGSGSLEMKDISGDLEINDGSGDINLKNIKGRIHIEDNSGSIDVADIEGDITIDDGSGSITVSDVDGSVTIDDGSGSIDIERIEQDVTINDDGSGGVYISDVKGKIHRYDID